MKRHPANSGRKREQGIIITLVAIFMLFVMGAMAALSIDVVTLYTARSEAQIAADSAALAGARVLANSGMTSSSDFKLAGSAALLCQNVGSQVAQSNQVGGQKISGGQFTVTCNVSSQGNPTVAVQVQVNLPAFFARIWGTTQVTVAASATAEAYNPSGGPGTSNTNAPTVAPVCVKPWLLPNLDPSTGTVSTIFGPSGTITNPKLLGWTSSTLVNGNPVPMTLACASSTCTLPLPAPQAWSYFPGDDTTFPHPTNSLPSCNPALTTNYQESIAGCIQIPISCKSPSNNPANIDVTFYPNPSRNSDTADAVNCLTHATSGGGDTVTSTNPPSAPFQFVIGSGNPVAAVTPTLVGSDAMVSDSLVTVPVFDTNLYNNRISSVPIIGFVQLFLNPDGNAAANSTGNVNTTVINMVGCAGTGAGAQAIIGNGASPVAVRLVTHQ